MHHLLRHWPRSVMKRGESVRLSVSTRVTPELFKRTQYFLHYTTERVMFLVAKVPHHELRDLLPTSALKTGTHFIEKQEACRKETVRLLRGTVLAE